MEDNCIIFFYHKRIKNINVSKFQINMNKHSFGLVDSKRRESDENISVIEGRSYKI